MKAMNWKAIYECILRDARYRKLDPEDRLVLLTLYLNEDTHRAGFNDSPIEKIGEETGLEEKELRQSFKNLQATEPPMIEVKDRVIFLKDWKTYVYSTQGLAKDALKDAMKQAEVFLPPGSLTEVADTYGYPSSDVMIHEVFSREDGRKDNKRPSKDIPNNSELNGINPIESDSLREKGIEDKEEEKICTTPSHHSSDERDTAHSEKKEAGGHSSLNDVMRLLVPVFCKTFAGDDNCKLKEKEKDQLLTVGRAIRKRFGGMKPEAVKLETVVNAYIRAAIDWEADVLSEKMDFWTGNFCSNIFLKTFLPEWWSDHVDSTALIIGSFKEPWETRGC